MQRACEIFFWIATAIAALIATVGVWGLLSGSTDGRGAVGVLILAGMLLGLGAIVRYLGRSDPPLRVRIGRVLFWTCFAFAAAQFVGASAMKVSLAATMPKLIVLLNFGMALLVLSFGRGLLYFVARE